MDAHDDGKTTATKEQVAGVLEAGETHFNGRDTNHDVVIVDVDLVLLPCSTAWRVSVR